MSLFLIFRILLSFSDKVINMTCNSTSFGTSFPLRSLQAQVAI